MLLLLEKVKNRHLKWLFAFNSIRNYYKLTKNRSFVTSIPKKCSYISAQISELGLTLAQFSTDDKSKEIHAVQELLKTLNIKRHVVVANALNCQEKQ